MTTLTTNIASNAVNNIYTITFTTTDEDLYHKVRLICQEAVDKEKADTLQSILDQFRREQALTESIKPTDDLHTCDNCRYSSRQHEPCITCCADGNYKLWAPSDAYLSGGYSELKR